MQHVFRKLTARNAILLAALVLIVGGASVLGLGAVNRSDTASAHSGNNTYHGDISVQLKENKVGGPNMTKGGVEIRVERLDGTLADCHNGAQQTTDGNGHINFNNCEAAQSNPGRSLRIKIRDQYKDISHDGKRWLVDKQEDTLQLSNGDSKSVDLVYDPLQDIIVRVDPDFKLPTPLIRIKRLGGSSAADDCVDGVTEQRTGQDGKVTFQCKATAEGRGYEVHIPDPGAGRSSGGAFWALQDPNPQTIQLFRANPKEVRFNYKVQCSTSINIFLFDYIIPTPADCFPNSQTDNSGPMMSFLLSSGSKGALAATQGYVPNQFIVTSSQPELNFDLRGGAYNQGAPRADGLGADFYAGDWGDTNQNQPWATVAANILGYASPVYYEVYQLDKLSPGNGRLLGIINPRDPNNFPGIDTNPSSQTCQTKQGAAADCWRRFTVNGNGGNITSNGSGQATIGAEPADESQYLRRGTFVGVDSGTKLSIPPGTGASTQQNHPNLNGMYGFLIKMVHNQDLKHGYVTGYTGFQQTSADDPNNPANTTSILCPQAEAGNTVVCPARLLVTMWAYNQAPSNHFVRNGYYLRSPKTTSGGGREFLSTAPANLTFDVGWGIRGNGQASLNDYDNYYNHQSKELIASAGGAGCRNDSYANLRSASNPDKFIADGGVTGTYTNNGKLVFGTNTGTAGNPDTTGGSDPQFFYTNSDFGSNTSANTTQAVYGGYRGEKDSFPLSGNYDDKYGPLDSVNLDNPNSKVNNQYPSRWLDNELESAGLITRNWAMSNEIYYGGAPFSWGQQPTCYRPTMISVTPQDTQADAGNNNPKYSYNGSDASTLLLNNTVDSRLRFGFTYQLPASPTSAAQSRTSNWTVEVRQNPGTASPLLSNSGTNAGTSGVQRVVANASIQAAGLSPKTNYYWRACAKGTSGGSAVPPFTAASALYGIGDTDESWNCTAQTPFQVNQGPNPTIQNPGTPINGVPTTNYCSVTAVKLDDPEGDNVSPRFTIAWTDAQGRSNRVSNAERGQQDPDGPVGPSGSVYNTGQVNVGSYTINGVAQSFDATQTLADFISQKVPTGQNSILLAAGVDRYGASDVNAFGRALAQTGVANRPLATADNYGPIGFGFQPASQDGTDFKWGPQASAIIRTAPNFGKPPASKVLLDPSTGQPFQGNVISDGQTVDVQLTLQNSGQTPMKQYRVIDYIGSVRDFETPTNFRFSFNGGATQNINPLGGVQQVTPSDDHSQPQNDQPFNASSTNSREHGQAAYKFDYGTNGGGILPAGELQPGQTLTFTYRIKANRNQSLEKVNDDANLNQTYQIGGTQSAESGQVELSAAYTYTDYQLDYCDSNSVKPQVIDFQPGDVLAPSLSAQRGSVYSNSGVAGYAGLSTNATYTVTANGNIAQFSGANQLEDYSASQRLLNGVCTNTPSDGIDWRRTMIQNIAGLKSGATTALGTTLSGNLNLGNGTVYQTPAGQGLTIGGNLTFTGQTGTTMSGTIIVNGDLTINGNLSYAGATPQASVGIIVLGNVIINPAVTQVVGSYYVSDVNYSTTPSGIDATTNCPAIVTTRGNVITGNSPYKLSIDGLIIARSFDFGRYYANPATANGPAEQIYYDGRVLSNAPPGFTTFARNTSWFEVAP